MTSARAAPCAAAVVALATLYTGIHWGAAVGGGADSYGYVSQAALWRAGRLAVRENIARQSPWPSAIETWAPLGYRAAPGSRDTIVPLYPPGLPLLMALFQVAGGFCAAFAVVPICGASAIWLTYGLGRRLGASAWASVAAATLVATSPIFLYQLMNPMTDVPATAAWTLAALLVAGGWLFGGGVAAAAALLIRPNLAPIAAALIVWIVATRQSSVRFLLGIGPAVLAVASINAVLYGAPWMSGYGSAADLYRAGHLLANVRQFGLWTIQTQTPIVLFAALPLLSPRLAPSGVRHARLLAGGLIAAVCLSYAFYIPFDAWWYLRFLLPMWPPLMVLVVLGWDRCAGRVGPVAPARWVGWIGAVGLLVFAANGVRLATARSTFDLGRGERRYIDVARFVATHTDSDAVMIALQHSGSLRLYAGRLTLRFDQLDPLWLDRAVAFLRDRGRHPYIVLERGEVDLFRRQFASGEVGRLEWPPLASLEDGSFVYDAIGRQTVREPLAIAATASRRTGWRCDPAYDERVPLRTE